MLRSMTTMALAAMALMVGLPLGGCTGTAGLTAALPAPKSPQQSVYDLKVALVVAEDGAITYQNTACHGVVPCTAPGASALNQAMLSADTLISAAETAVRSGGNATGAIAQAQAAITTLQTLVTQYAATKGATAS